MLPLCRYLHLYKSKRKGLPRQAEVALGVPGSLRPRIITTFGTTSVVGRQPNAFTPAEIPGTHFQRRSRPQGTWFCQKEPRIKSQVTPPGIDPGTVRLHHYATPGLFTIIYLKQTMFLRYTFLQLFCICSLCYM